MEVGIKDPVDDSLCAEGVDGDGVTDRAVPKGIIVEITPRA